MISEAGSAQCKQGILRCRDSGHGGSRGAADFGGSGRHFARETDAGNSSTVAGIHGPRGGNCGSQLGAGLHAGIAGTCVAKGEPAAVDYMVTAVSTSVNDCAAGRWCRALAEDNNGAAVVEVAEGSPSLLASQTSQVGIQTLSRKTFLDACNEPTVIGRWPMLANNETGRRCRWVSYNDDDSRTDLDTAAGALLHDTPI